MRSPSAERIGSQRPAKQHLPADIVTSVAPDVIELAETAGLFLDDWQKWVLHYACAESIPDVAWSAFEVSLLVSRQNGKGSILEARQLAGLFYFREPFAVHSAHEFKTAHEHFLRMINLIEGTPDLDRQVHKIRRGAGEQAIELKTGERLRFIARSTGSGRGMTGDVVYLDEAFALTPAMMGALMPTLSAVPNPQIWYTSSAPRKESEVLHGIRKRAVEGGSDRLFHAEWCADPDVTLDDVDAWYQANPALGIRISEDYVRSEFDAMRHIPQEFLRERLGVPEEPEGIESGPVPLEVWESLTDGQSATAGAVRLAFDMSSDRQWSTFGLAGRRLDGLTHVEVRDSKPGTDWVVARCKELTEGHGVPVSVVKGSPGASFIDVFQSSGIRVDVVSTAEYAEFCGRFIDATRGEQPSLRHRGDPRLMRSLATVQTKPAGDGGVVWSRRTSTADISPLTAATVAFGRLDELVPVSSGGFVDLSDFLDDE